jgi:hypothetical protein
MYGLVSSVYHCRRVWVTLLCATELAQRFKIAVVGMWAYHDAAVSVVRHNYMCWVCLQNLQASEPPLALLPGFGNHLFPLSLPLLGFTIIWRHVSTLTPLAHTGVAITASLKSFLLLLPQNPAL